MISERGTDYNALSVPYTQVFDNVLLIAIKQIGSFYQCQSVCQISSNLTSIKKN